MCDIKKKIQNIIYSSEISFFCSTIVSFVLFTVLFSIFYSLIISFNSYINFSTNEIITTAVSLTLGFAIIIFTYLEHKRREDEKKPLIGFEISFEGCLISANGDSKGPRFLGDMKTQNIFLVVKNISPIPLYNLKILLRGTYEEVKENQGKLREVKLPALMPGEFKLFNTNVTPEGLKNSKLKNYCIITYTDQTFTKTYSYTYNLIDNKEYILSLIEEFSQENELSAIIAYKEILSFRTFSNLEKKIKSLDNNLEHKLSEIERKLR